jgi:hypothetical protein
MQPISADRLTLLWLSALGFLGALTAFVLMVE